MHDGYAEIRHGGALVIDLSKLTRCGPNQRRLIACRQPENISQRKGTGIGPIGVPVFRRGPVARGTLLHTDVLLPMRHLGLTSVFRHHRVSVSEIIFSDTDNLFLCQVTPDDARHLAKRSRVDAATLQMLDDACAHTTVCSSARPQGNPISSLWSRLDSIEVTVKSSLLTRAYCTSYES